jgi:hypothetical protein
MSTCLKETSPNLKIFRLNIKAVAAAVEPELHRVKGLRFYLKDAAPALDLKKIY